jgi:hypothetical protein
VALLVGLGDWRGALGEGGSQRVERRLLRGTVLERTDEQDLDDQTQQEGGEREQRPAR